VGKVPVSTRKVDGYRVSTPGGVKAKGTTKAKAGRLANLLRAVEHGWKPTGKPARDKQKGALKHYLQRRKEKRASR